MAGKHRAGSPAPDPWEEEGFWRELHPTEPVDGFLRDIEPTRSKSLGRYFMYGCAWTVAAFLVVVVAYFVMTLVLAWNS